MERAKTRSTAGPSNSPAELAVTYAREVVDGKILAGPYVRLACQRFLRDLERTDWPYEFRPKVANDYMAFIALLPHVKSDWASKGQSLVLEPWQCFVECQLFGWVHKDTGLRRFRSSYEEVPRKNGKSTRVAARGIYLFAADGEVGSEVYAGATTEKQALEVFRPAWQMVYKLPKLRRTFSVEQAGNANNPGPMYRIRDMSRFEPMIGKPGDGSSPHGAIVDEYHEHDSDHMVQAMQTGMGARKQPLLSIITTAGSNLGGPCYDRRRDLISILEGNAEDETVFGVIHGIDETDAWDDPDNLKKANPNYGVSVFPEYLHTALAQARRSSSWQNYYRTKHLNQWVGARTAWMNMVAWQRQKGSFKPSDFAGCQLWIGADLASKLDVTALIALYLKNGQYYCIPYFYVPESALEDNEKYREFVTGGDMVATPGNTTDYGFLEEQIRVIARQGGILQDIAFDPSQAAYLTARLQQERLPVVELTQNVRNLSEPMKEVEAQVLSGKLWHDGNRAMTWMVGQVVAKLDAKENIFPRKEDTRRNKIDGPVALIIAMARAMLLKQQPNYRIFFVG